MTADGDVRTLEFVPTIPAANARRSSRARTLHHWVAGAHHKGSGDRFSHLTDPATGEVTGRLALASVADVDAAVTVARAAFPRWRDTPPERRTEVVFRFRELLGARAADLAEIITVEHGKVLSEARGEVARGQEVLEIACDIRYGLQDGAAGDASTRVDVSAFRQPVGPVAILSPFNLPAMVPMWFLPITIAAGNTVVLKPSEKVPSAALWLARLWAEAGLPEGVFNVVHGDKVAVERLLTHPDIKAVTAAPLTASRTRSRSA